jgi:hypothetical protein
VVDDGELANLEWFGQNATVLCIQDWAGQHRDRPDALLSQAPR